MTETVIRPMSEEYADYLRDESRTVGQAESISFPRTEEEIVRVLARCSQEGIQVTVQGARTGLAAAAVPREGHILNLTRMDRVVGMDRLPDGRFLLQVQPGVVLSRLRKMIEDRRFDTAGWDKRSLEVYREFAGAPEQFFPTDPTETTATIGGMAACNASGAMSYRYGPVRGHIHGLRLVLPSGDTLALERGEASAKGRSLTLQTGGGKALSLELPTYIMPGTKNASGYYVEDDMDAVDLFIGSDGTLGVFSEITLILSEKPPVIWGVSCFFRTEETAVGFVVRARESLEQVVSAEYFDAGALEILREQKRSNTAFAGLPEIPAAFCSVVYLELHCADEPEALRELFSVGMLMTAVGAGEGDTWVARTAFDRDKLYFFRHAVPESVNMLIDRRRQEHPGITKLGTDMAVPDEHLREIIATYRRMLAEEELEYAFWGHIGDNHLHVNILPRNPEDQRKGKELYGKWAEIVTKMGGSVSAEHGVGKIKADYLRVMYGEEHIGEMAALKTAFDPGGIVGRGNLFAEELLG